MSDYMNSHSKQDKTRDLKSDDMNGSITHDNTRGIESDDIACSWMRRMYFVNNENW